MLIDTQALHTHFRLDRHRLLRAVDGVNLSIKQGQVMGLVGESGSGKSTLGKTLLGLIDKTSGQVVFDGKPLPQHYSTADFRRFAGDMQMIFQDPYGSFNPRMTVYEALCEPLQLRSGLSPAQMRELASHWLQRVGLPSKVLSRYPHEFSGGQRQRLGIARALIAQPRFVVCDEPVSALDVSIGAQIIMLLKELQDTYDLTLLFIAHDLSVVRYISDRIAVMYRGKLVEEGPTEALYCQPRHPYTEKLIASSPIADPLIEKQRNHEPLSGEVSAPINAQAGCGFAERCDQAQAVCHASIPKMKSIGNEHRVACHLYN